MRPRFVLLFTFAALMSASASCAPSQPATSAELTSVCAETGRALDAVERAELAAIDERRAATDEWNAALGAVGDVVAEARAVGNPDLVQLAEGWETAVRQASTAPDARAAFEIMVDSEDALGLLFVCEAAGVEVPGWDGYGGEPPQSDFPVGAGWAAWIVLGAAGVATAFVRSRRPDAHLVRGALQGVVTGSVAVLAAIVGFGAWLASEVDLFGLSASPLDGMRAALSDPGTPIWALLLGGTTGGIIGAATVWARRRSGRDVAP